MSLAVLSLLALSCDEALPPRIEPAKFLKASIRVQPNSVVNVDYPYIEPNGDYSGGFRFNVEAVAPHC